MSTSKYTLVLRTCTKDMTGTHEQGRAFVWPRKGHVKAPDWDPKPECGHGLHGLAWGEGGASYLSSEPDAVWLVVRVLTASLVWIDGDKVKYPEGTVVHAGDRPSATRYLWEQGGSAHRIVCLSMTGGDGSTLTGGDGSTLTGGDWCTLTGGYRSTLTGGYESTLTGGYGSTLTGGYESTLTGGYESTLTGGYGSTLTWRYYDGERRRIHTVYAGEDGIKADTPYLGSFQDGKFVVEEKRTD